MSTTRLTYIWIGLLCVGIFAQALLASYVVVTTNNQQEADIELTKATAELAGANSEALERQQETIRLLCDRGYLIGDVLLAQIDMVNAQNPKPPGSVAFLRSMNVAYNQIIDELTRPGSACVR